MSIISMEMFCVKCNSCTEWFADNDNGSSFFYTADEARYESENNDWYTHGEKHYCPHCYKIDDNDILHIEKKGERYNLELDEPNCYININDQPQ